MEVPSSSSPIVRFGRWARALTVGDFVVILVLSPLAGMMAVLVPYLLLGGRRHYSGGVLRNAVENMTVGITALCLLALGGVLARISPNLGRVAALTIMSVFVVWALIGTVRGEQGHNILPVELLGYGALTGLAVVGGGLAVKLGKR